MAMLEALESRVLMSTTPSQISEAVNRIHSEALFMVGDLQGVKAELASDSKTIAADLNAAGLAKADKTMLSAAAAKAKHLLANLGRAFHTNAATLNHQVNKLAADGNVLLKKPTSTKQGKKVNTDIAALSAHSSIATNAYDSAADWSSFYTSLQSIAQANPSASTLSSDITKTVNRLNTLLVLSEMNAESLFVRDVISLEILFEA
jgi:hypothetical protein